MSEKTSRILILISYSIFTLLPIYWTTNLSFQKDVSFPPTYFPDDFGVVNYINLLNTRGIVTSILNSLMVAALSALVSIIVCSMAGYAFSQLEMWGKKFLFGAVLATLLLPPTLNIIPMYSVFSELGWLNSRLAMVLLYQLSNMPLNTFLFTNYFDTIEEPIVESAIVDGAGPFRRFVSIFIPLSKPAVIAGYLFAFRFSWMEYLFGATFIKAPSKRLFPAALKVAVRSSQYSVDYGIMTAGGILLLVPTLLILVFGQRYLEAGLQLGGVD
ncbi:carbohydrate ABC transporter permease [Candidatus Bipolaricaulota bacterium]|nr:carbohydrate ABC transporter permease [Candidatus Bipolaricaulota bacterium]